VFRSKAEKKVAEAERQITEVLKWVIASKLFDY
jgi:hypothetical protein